jgi:hypothetical protein
MLFPLLSQLWACIAAPAATTNNHKRAIFMIEQYPLHMIMAAARRKFR